MDRRTLRRGERLSVVQLLHEGYEHMHAFDEVAASLHEGLCALGFDADLVRGRPRVRRRSILLGAHTLPDAELTQLPKGTIVYNHEQIDPESMLGPRRLRAFQRLGVWDYSRRNVAAWAEAGVRASFVPIGWSPGLRAIDPVGPKDIDVLFYGSINDRRRRVLEAIARRGARVEVAFGAYGAARDALIARARLVLNIQYYEARILEMVRLSYLFANEVPVVSETSAGIDAPEGFGDAAAFVTYDRLVSTTLQLLDDQPALDALGRRGRSAMEAWPWARSLAAVAAVADVEPPPDAARPGGEPVVLVVGISASLDAGHREPQRPEPQRPEPQRTVAEALAARSDEVVRAVGGGLGGLGPPPVVDPDDPALQRHVADAVTWWSGPDGPRPGDRIELPGGGPVAAFWAEIAHRASSGLQVEVVIGSPVPDIDEPVAAARSVLRWLGSVLFSEAMTRDLERTIRVDAAEVEMDLLAPALRFPAMQRAADVVAALRRGPDDAATRAALDQQTEALVDAMSLYLPLLDELDPPS